jgi:hypothetical protein
MYQTIRRLTAASAVVMLMFTAARVDAQAIYGAAEIDDDETSFFFLGGSWGVSGLGWKPYVALSAYHLRFDAGSVTRDRNVVVPSIGLINRKADGSFGGSVGYAFSDEDVSGQPLLVGAESGDGVVGALQWNHWGSGGHALQALASYNFGTQFLWTRGRASRPLTSTSPLWVGGEAALMGGGDSDTYIAQFGPTVEWRFNPQFRLGGSAGFKVGVSNASGSAAYGRLEFLWLPTAR